MRAPTGAVGVIGEGARRKMGRGALGDPVGALATQLFQGINNLKRAYKGVGGDDMSDEVG